MCLKDLFYKVFKGGEEKVKKPLNGGEMGREEVDYRPVGLGLITEMIPFFAVSLKFG